MGRKLGGGHGGVERGGQAMVGGLINARDGESRFKPKNIKKSQEGCLTRKVGERVKGFRKGRCL